MISQADIIRTLINKSCTDESIMTTALSPGCTLPKLLEKLTEAEKFDLALDFSMKVGLEVSPIWMNWAMRCLKSRHFTEAREKFRLCLARLRIPGGARRGHPTQNRLLSDILKELVKMDEFKMPLADEIQLIKEGKYPRKSDSSSKDPPLLCKPTIYNECLYYLNEYGTVEDCIIFHSKNRLWDETIKILIDKSKEFSVEKFIQHVYSYATSTGHLSQLLEAFLRMDPNILNQSTANYFDSMCKFCSRTNRFNTLYFIQTRIWDLTGAADTQIRHFFLRKPIKNYHELIHRTSSLIKARQNYIDCIKSLSQSDDPDDGQRVRKIPGVFSSKSKEDADMHIKVIDLQITITRNFDVNEVSGCIGLECVCLNDEIEENSTKTEDKSPVTLFDEDLRRKTIMAALVLIYFDPLCRTNFSKEGLDTTNKIIYWFGLDMMKVFKTAMRIIIEDESCDIIENANLLLERIKENYTASVDNSEKSDKRMTIHHGIINNINHSINNHSSRQLRATGKGGRRSLQLSRMESGNFYSGSFDESNSAHDDVKSIESKDSSSSLRNKITELSLSPSSSSTLSELSTINICDEIIRDSIDCCREPDYKMELAELLSDEAKYKVYIEHGKLSNAQRLAFSMNRPDYVSRIVEEAAKLNQHHVKTVCQLWLAKHQLNQEL